MKLSEGDMTASTRTTESVTAFAERARTWLADFMPRIDDPNNPPYADRGEEDSWQHVRQLQRRLYDGGFAGICFPAEYGGLGLGIEYQKAFDAESADYEMPLIEHPDIHHLLRDDPRHRHRRAKTPTYLGCVTW
jgi:alkylation response protein AidB-like acyl-CoA dehydrogenase